MLVGDKIIVKNKLTMFGTVNKGDICEVIRVRDNELYDIVGSDGAWIVNVPKGMLSYNQ